VVSLGSAICAFLGAGGFKTIEDAQDKICRTDRDFQPDKSIARIYDNLYELYSKLYFAFGQPREQFGDVLPKLIEISSAARTVVRSGAA